VRWSSTGTGEFDVEQIHKAERGTDIILHLREDALDYLESYKVKQIINKYSDHISLPIQMQKEVWQQEEAAEGETPKAGQYVKTDEWEAINSASALWTHHWHGRITALKAVLNTPSCCMCQVKHRTTFLLVKPKRGLNCM
jgi:molecular chaperone HtpG